MNPPNLTYARGTAIEDLVVFEKQNPWAEGFVVVTDYPEQRASAEEVPGRINRDDVRVTNQQIASMTSLSFKKNRFVGRRMREPTAKYADVPSRGFRKMEAMKNLLPRIDRLKVLDVGCGVGGFTTYVACVARKAKIFCVTLPKAELFDYGAFEKNVSSVGTGSAVKIVYADIMTDRIDAEITEFMSDQVDLVVSDAGERHSSIAEQAAWLANGYGEALTGLVRTHLRPGGCMCLKVMGIGKSLEILKKIALGFSDMRAVSEPESGGASAEVYLWLYNYQRTYERDWAKRLMFVEDLITAKRMAWLHRVAEGKTDLGLRTVVMPTGSGAAAGRVYLQVTNEMNVEGDWPLETKAILEDYEFNWRGKIIAIKSHTARTIVETRAILSKRYQLFGELNSPFKNLALLHQWMPKVKKDNLGMRECALTKGAFAATMGISSLTQGLAFSLPTTGKLRDGLARVDFPATPVDARWMTKALDVAAVIVKRVKASIFDWVQVKEHINRKGAFGVFESWSGTLGEMVEDPVFQRFVERMESRLERGEFMPAWYNIQGKLELKVRALVDQETSDWETHIVNELMELKRTYGPAKLRARLESDLYIGTL